MEKNKSIKNVTVSIVFKIILMITAIFVKKYLINYVSNEANGVNSLFLSIIGSISIAELGVGAAIAFCMYKPIHDKDKNKVVALYQLFNKTYLIIGFIIFALGLCILPFLPILAKDYTLSSNIYFTFTLMLISVVISYFYSSKTGLINAYRDNYLTTTITSIGTLIQHLLQIIVLILTRSFELYLMCRIVSALIQWIITEIYARKKYKQIIIATKQQLDNATREDVTKNIKAMFMHKLGDILSITMDSIVISAFISVAILGKYSNYRMIMTNMTGVIVLFFSPLTSIIGNMCVKANLEQQKKYFDFFHSFNIIIGLVFFLGYYATIDNIVYYCFGSNIELGRNIIFVLSLNNFILFMKRSVFLFRDATGTFYAARWKGIIEGIINLILSLILVNIIGIVGVLVATIVTTLLITHIVEPFVIYKNIFKTSPQKFYFKNYFAILLFTGALIIVHLCMQEINNQLIEMITNASISLLLSGVITIIFIIFNKNFRSKTFALVKLLYAKVRFRKIEE